jgi:putative SOS response-associated peptidase YedK
LITPRAHARVRGANHGTNEWRGPEEQLLSCTIVVGRPNALVAEIHDRMVVNLPEEAYATWLIREPAWIPCGP